VIEIGERPRARSDEFKKKKATSYRKPARHHQAGNQGCGAKSLSRPRKRAIGSRGAKRESIEKLVGGVTAAVELTTEWWRRRRREWSMDRPNIRQDCQYLRNLHRNIRRGKAGKPTEFGRW